MERRDFLISAAAIAGATVAGTGVETAWARQTPQQRAKLDRIAIMSYSFSSILKNPAQADDPKRTLEVMDLPQMYVDRYGVHNIEMQHSHFESTEPEYLKAFRERVDRVGSRIIQINGEFGPLNMSVPERTRRLETIDLTKRWIDHCAMLGCPRLMLNQGNLAPEVRPTAIEALRAMARYGDQRGVWVTLENRGQTGWENVVEVVRAANSYTTPDLGNYPDQETQLRGIRAMYPMHRGNAHVKLNPERYDATASIRLMKELGYTGLYSVEATSNVSPDAHVATQRVLDMLLATI